MAGPLRPYHGGHGIPPRVLDSGLRCAGTTRHSAVSRESAEYEECTGKTHRLSRVSVDPAFAFNGIAAFSFPAGWRSVRSTFVDAASQRSGGNGQPACAAHAKGPHPDE